MIYNLILIHTFMHYPYIQVYLVLQDIESINKSQTRSYRHRFLMTVEMMYKKIAKALTETKIKGSLNEIFLLGKKA